MHAVLAGAARTLVRAAPALVTGLALAVAPTASAAAPAEVADPGPEHGELELARPQPGMNVARVLFATKATERPAGRGRLLARLRPLAPLGGGPTQLRVTAQKVVDGRLSVRVQLPRRPNGLHGWIPGDDVELSRTDYAVAIDTRARRVAVTRRGRTLRTFRAVVGRAASPTPRGAFAVAEVIAQFPRTRFLGSWVLPLTAYSGTYREFRGGPGLVAIHGRGADSFADPLGSAASHGCVRVSNAAADWMAARLEPGVPVTVR